MVGLFVIAVLVVGLILGLQPAHRRSWRPGVETRNDRDRARLIDELSLLESFEESQPVPSASATGGEGQETSPPVTVVPRRPEAAVSWSSSPSHHNNSGRRGRLSGGGSSTAAATGTGAGLRRH